MKTIILLTLCIIIVIFISGCSEQNASISDKDKAIYACKKECNSLLNQSKDLSNGPCILNPINDVPDWICDVAHEPRQDIDNKIENQCSAFREEKAHHFVEVTPNCELIQTW
jgi:hypothetical protein